jgi:L-2-hydroxycarboxylate dehydrogenase (NAD+)
VAFRAIDAATKLVDRFGNGMVSVHNAFHYLWGSGYVMAAAKRSYIAYTNCMATLAEVAPHDRDCRPMTV